MTYTITVHVGSDTRPVAAEQGETLLNALSRGGIAVSAPCGGRGRCGKCAVKAAGAFTRLPSEGNEQVKEGFVLSCQALVEGDAEVWLSEGESRILADGVLTSFESDGEEGYGVAVDIGTTTIAAYLMELTTGRTLSLRTMLNPQRNHGADVISRLSYAMESAENARQMQREVLDALDAMTAEMCAEAKVDAPIAKRVCVGNTVMMHLLGGYEVSSLAFAPFTPAYTSQHENVLKGINTLLGGCISGYVGADTVAAALACDLDRKDETQLLIDIGTNGEIVLKHKGQAVCCSCAAGPAFEGAHIACGTGAVTGAVDHARIENGRITFTTIGGGEATGICGSGLIDLVALLVEEEEISPSGRMSEDVHLTDSVYLARADVREVQLAKSAIASGVAVLMEELHIDHDDIDVVYIAGGFGNFINMENACKIGMLDPSLAGKVRPVGNAAGDGARRMLLCEKMRERAAAFRDSARYIELAAHPSFNDLFVENLIFGDDE